MTAHVSGGIPSPSCLNCALKKTAAGEELSFILRRNFYVDDMLESSSSTKIVDKFLEVTKFHKFTQSNHCARKVDLTLQNSLVII